MSSNADPDDVDARAPDAPRLGGDPGPLGRGVGQRLDRRKFAGRHEQPGSRRDRRPRTTSVMTATEAYGSRANSCAESTRPESSRPVAVAGAASKTPSILIISGVLTPPMITWYPSVV